MCGKLRAKQYKTDAEITCAIAIITVTSAKRSAGTELIGDGPGSPLIRPRSLQTSRSQATTAACHKGRVPTPYEHKEYSKRSFIIFANTYLLTALLIFGIVYK